MTRDQMLRDPVPLIIHKCLSAVPQVMESLDKVPTGSAATALARLAFLSELHPSDQA